MLDSAKAARTEQESTACGEAQEDLKIDGRISAFE
jgi:hypothetical protein